MTIFVVWMTLVVYYDVILNWGFMQEWNIEDYFIVFRGMFCELSLEILVITLTYVIIQNWSEIEKALTKWYLKWQKD
jgi:hypothetical protein